MVEVQCVRCGTVETIERTVETIERTVETIERTITLHDSEHWSVERGNERFGLRQES